MNDFAAKKGEASMSHFDIVRRIETMSGEIPYAIKQFKSQTLAFCSMDKKLSAMKSKTEKRASSKKLDKLEEYITEYRSAYRKCRQNYTSILKALDEIEALYSRLSDYYHSEGKRREAKRAIADAEKFDKPARKQLEQIYEKLEAAAEIDLAKDGKPMPDAAEEPKERLGGAYREEMGEEDARRRREDTARRYNHNTSGA